MKRVFRWVAYASGKNERGKGPENPAQEESQQQSQVESGRTQQSIVGIAGFALNSGCGSCGGPISCGR